MQYQLNLNKGRWGGRRSGAGRKRLRTGNISHEKREKITHKIPLHITLKYRSTVRNKDTLKLLKRGIRNARTHGLVFKQFSFQSNHIHLIVEARDNSVLTKGMRSLAITFAKGLKQGRVQVHRYHLHALRTIAETRNALWYVMFNQQKHDSGTCSSVNEYSSLLSLENGLELIRKFAKNRQVTIKVEKGEKWVCDPGGSYLYVRAFNELFI